MTTHNSNTTSIFSIQSKNNSDHHNDIESQTPSLEKNNEAKRQKNESKSVHDEIDECNDAEVVLIVEEHASGPNKGKSSDEDNGRERLKRHRVEVAGRVWIPDIWGQEELLKDWIDCSAFDASLMNSNIVSARAALVEERRRANSSCRLRIENSC